MTTNAELAARLLREAAVVYRSLGGSDVDVRQRMEEFGNLYERVADLVEKDPGGAVPGLQSD